MSKSTWFSTNIFVKCSYNTASCLSSQSFSEPKSDLPAPYKPPANPPVSAPGTTPASPPVPKPIPAPAPAPAVPYLAAPLFILCHRSLQFHLLFVGSFLPEDLPESCDIISGRSISGSSISGAAMCRTSASFSGSVSDEVLGK